MPELNVIQDPSRKQSASKMANTEATAAIARQLFVGLKAEKPNASMANCNLLWLPLDGLPRFNRCPNEATVDVFAPGAKRSQKICSYHAGQIHELSAVANGIAEESLRKWT